MLVGLVLTDERGRAKTRLVTLAEAARGVAAPRRAALAVVSATLVLSWACAVPLPVCASGSSSRARFGAYEITTRARRARAYVSVASHAPPRPLACELLRNPALRERARVVVGMIAARSPLPRCVWRRILAMLLT